VRKRKISQKVIGSFVAILGILAAGKGWCADTTNSVPTSNSTDPLLDLFIKKGYVTQQEADQVRAEAQQSQSNYVANIAAQQSIWKIADGIKRVELYGDLRFRYERRNATDGADNIIQLNRIRYALRVGLRGDAFDDFYYGFRLETAQNPRSPWVTLGTSSSSSPYQGPFGKSAGGINVGQIYMGWRLDDSVDITIGKMPNLIYTTPMVWDNDLNPEGAVERFKYTVDQADLFVNFGQYLYADFNPEEASPGLGIGAGTTGVGQKTMDTWMFVWQGGFNYHFTPTTSAKVAATLYNYAGLQKSTAGNTSTSPYFGDPYIGEGAYYLYGGNKFNNAPGFAGYSPGTQFNTVPGEASVSYPFNQVGLNNLLVLEAPFEVNFRVDNIATRVFGDFAYNLEGSQRAQDAASGYSAIINSPAFQPPAGNALPHSFAAQTHDVKAYQIGFGFGSDDLVYGPTAGLVYGTSSHKHDWEFRTYWQHIEQYSLDPNLIDSDFFEGRENLQGIYAALAFAVSDNVILTVRYGQAWRINDVLGTGGDNQDIPQMNPINHYHLFQADADFRF
jgi:hypothetical protein